MTGACPDQVWSSVLGGNSGDGPLCCVGTHPGILVAAVPPGEDRGTEPDAVHLGHRRGREGPAAGALAAWRPPSPNCAWAPSPDHLGARRTPGCRRARHLGEKQNAAVHRLDEGEVSSVPTPFQIPRPDAHCRSVASSSGGNTDRRNRGQNRLGQRLDRISCGIAAVFDPSPGNKVAPDPAFPQVRGHFAPTPTVSSRSTSRTRAGVAGGGPGRSPWCA